MLSEPDSDVGLFPRHNVTVIRDNSVNVPLNFGAYKEELSLKTITSKKETLIWQWYAISSIRNPKILWEYWIESYKNDIVLKLIWGVGFAGGHWSDTWIPNGVLSKDDNGLNHNFDHFIKPMFKLCGYELIDTTDTHWIFAMVEVYATSILLTRNESDHKNSHLMLEFDNKDKIYTLPWGNHQFDYFGLKKLDLERRKIVINKNSNMTFVDRPVSHEFEIWKGKVNEDSMMDYLEHDTGMTENLGKTTKSLLLLR